MAAREIPHIARVPCGRRSEAIGDGRACAKPGMAARTAARPPYPPRNANRKESAMTDNEPASGYNLPPGCLDRDIERAFGAERRRCGECRHCIESDELDRCICGIGLADAVARLEGAQRRSPEYILAAVEGATTDEDDCCADFEG